MSASLLRRLLQPFGQRLLRGMISSELEGQMHSQGLGPYRPDKKAIARLVEEVMFRAGPLTTGTKEEAVRMLSEAKWVAEQVATYRVDRIRCDQSIRSILDFHGGLLRSYLNKR